MPKRYCSIRKQILCSASCLSKVLQWIPALDLAFITFSAYPLLPPSSTLHCNSNSLQRAEVPPPSLLHCITLQQQLSAMQRAEVPPPPSLIALHIASHCSSAVQSSNSSRSTFPIELQQLHQTALKNNLSRIGMSSQPFPISLIYLSYLPRSASSHLKKSYLRL